MPSLFSSGCQNLDGLLQRCGIEAGGLGPLRHCREYAAKNAEYMARLAGLIHHSSGEEDISPYTAEMARELAIWYGNEYVRLSNPLTFDNPA